MLFGLQVLKFLMERNSTSTLHGQVTIGTLILQVCSCFMLIFLLCTGNLWPNCYTYAILFSCKCTGMSILFINVYHVSLSHIIFAFQNCEIPLLARIVRLVCYLPCFQFSAVLLVFFKEWFPWQNCKSNDLK